MKHNTDGQLAEEQAARYLSANGFRIHDKNWKTKTCEIDIIASKDNVMHFVEVKFRSSPRQGSGFEYITRTKIRQMSYAADLWTAKNNWQNEYVLSGVEVSGPDFRVVFIEQIY